MAQRVTPQPRAAAIIHDHLNGNKPSLLQVPLVEFLQLDPPKTVPAYASSRQQVILPGKDKTKAVGTQHLGKNKRAAAADPEQLRLSIHPNNLIDLADSYFRQRDYQNALTCYENISSKNDPANLQMALYRKSKCCWMLGQLKNAQECLTYLLKLYPDYAQAWARRGAILLQQHKYPEALADLKRSFELTKTPPHFVEYTLLFDCYDSFTNATDTTAFHLQHVSYDFLGNPLVSEDDLHLLRGIFFASRQNYTSAIEELSIAAKKTSNSLAIQTLEIVKNIHKRRGHVVRQQPESVTLQAKRVPISVLLNND